MKKLYTVMLGALLLATGVANAQARRSITLHMGDVEYARTGFIPLKQILMQQHRRENPESLELESVILVAKSMHGNGQADLRVGNAAYAGRIGGRPVDYNNPGDWTFDNVVLYNSQRTSLGPWQIDLRGFNKVRRIILNVRDRWTPPPRPRPQPIPNPGPAVTVSVKGQGYFPDQLTANGVCLSKGFRQAVGSTQWKQAGAKIEGLRSFDGSAFFQSHIWYSGMALDNVLCQ